LSLFVPELDLQNVQSTGRQIIDFITNIEQLSVLIVSGPGHFLPMAPCAVVHKLLPLQLHFCENRLCETGVGINLLNVVEEASPEILV
jgi:hypothetical protein